MNENLTPEQKQEIEAYIFSGKKIQAIKALREAANIDLINAKRAVEEYENTLRDTVPRKFTVEAKKGCMACLVLFLAIAIPLTVFVLKTLE